jgi:hypothetical protein
MHDLRHDPEETIVKQNGTSCGNLFDNAPAPRSALFDDAPVIRVYPMTLGELLSPDARSVAAPPPPLMGVPFPATLPDHWRDTHGNVPDLRTADQRTADELAQVRADHFALLHRIRTLEEQVRALAGRAERQRSHD